MNFLASFFGKENDCESQLTGEQLKEIERLKEGINFLKKLKKKVNDIQKKLAANKIKEIEFTKTEFEPLINRLNFLIKKFEKFQLPEIFFEEYSEYYEFFIKNFELINDQFFVNEFKFKTSKLTSAIFRTSQSYIQKIKEIKSNPSTLEKTLN